jgi:hypothetical protein
MPRRIRIVTASDITSAETNPTLRRLMLAELRLELLYYNFCRVHSTLRVTSAMEAGISNHIWSIEELCGLLPETASATKRIGKGLILKALG